MGPQIGVVFDSATLEAHCIIDPTDSAALFDGTHAPPPGMEMVVIPREDIAGMSLPEIAALALDRRTAP